MKKFKFTLQAVHNVRESQQEREQVILRQLQTEVDVAAQQIQEVEKRRLLALDTYARRIECGEQFDPLEMDLNAKYLISLNSLEREKRAILAQKKQACERQSRTVAAAAQAVKATAKIRESQNARHILEMSRREQINLDEMVSLSFARSLSQSK